MSHCRIEPTSYTMNSGGGVEHVQHAGPQVGLHVEGLHVEDLHYTTCARRSVCETEGEERDGDKG